MKSVVLALLLSFQAFAVDHNEVLKATVLKEWSSIDRSINGNGSEPVQAQYQLLKETLKCFGAPSLESDRTVGTCHFRITGRTDSVDALYSVVVREDSKSESGLQLLLVDLSWHHD